MKDKELRKALGNPRKEYSMWSVFGSSRWAVDEGSVLEELMGRLDKVEKKLKLMEDFVGVQYKGTECKDPCYVSIKKPLTTKKNAKKK